MRSLLLSGRIAAYYYENGDWLTAARWLKSFWESGEPMAVRNVNYMLDVLESEGDDPETHHDLGVINVELGRFEKGVWNP